MKSLSKVCDGADWFRPPISSVILNELREPARFHRKQWEFASIFEALGEYGFLDSGATGLSMGGGRERLLYSLANHLGSLVVTDLYDPETNWECARTGNPEEYVKADPPFLSDLSRITVRRADMRSLPFSSESFDFCYSTCAMEHIGGRLDFLQHFREVDRVLKEGGIYIFTTEFHYGPEVIEDPGNFVFSWEYLKDLFRQTKLIPEPVFDATLAQHDVNLPMPGNLQHLSFEGDEALSSRLLEKLPHIQLLRGRYPFTTALFVLRKSGSSLSCPSPEIVGLEASYDFLQKGVDRYRELLEHHPAAVQPFSLLPKSASPSLAGHEEFIAEEPLMEDVLFHTDYFWWGSGARSFEIEFDAGPLPAEVNLRVHGYRTLNPGEVSCVLEHRLHGRHTQRAVLTLEADEDCCYAVLGNHAGAPFPHPRSATIRTWGGGPVSDSPCSLIPDEVHS